MMSPEQVFAEAIRDENASNPNAFTGAEIQAVADFLQRLSPRTFNREMWVDYANGGPFPA